MTNIKKINNDLVIINHSFNTIKDNNNDIFCGSPHYLLKFCRLGSVYGWKPLSIEICLVDDDDYDCDYGYVAKSEEEFNSIINDICCWFNLQDTATITINEIINFIGIPHFEKFNRTF